MEILGSTTDFKSVFPPVEGGKQQWKAAVDALPELICVVDEDGRIVRANQAVAQWTNILVTEAEGKALHHLLHPTCRHTCYIERLLSYVKKGVDLLNPVEVQIFDPHLQKQLLFRARRIGEKKDSDNSNMIVIVQDVTKQHSMEQALRDNSQRLQILNAISKSILVAQTPQKIAGLVLKQMTALVPHSFAGIMSYDSNLEKMTILGVSGAEADSFNVQKRKDVDHLFSDKRVFLRRFFVIDDVAQTPALHSLLSYLSLEEMKSVWNIPLMVEKRFIGTMILADKKRHAFERNQYPVVKEVAELLTVALRQTWLRRRLEKSNENLQNLLRDNRQQLQTVTHELRSPLSIIKGYTEMFHTGMLGPLTAEQKDVLRIVQNKGNQLIEMVQNLFTVQKMDSESLHRQDICPAKFLQEIVDSWQVLASNKEIKLAINLEPDLPTLHADKNLLHQLFSNLIDNAIKYSGVDDAISVSARVTFSEVIISIADQGRGIPPSKLESIFQRYYQVDKSAEQEKLGAGIGLALCHGIVQAHNGRIWAESDGEGQGSTFFVALPVGLSNQDLAS